MRIIEVENCGKCPYLDVKYNNVSTWVEAHHSCAKTGVILYDNIIKVKHDFNTVHYRCPLKEVNVVTGYVFNK